MPEGHTIHRLARDLNRTLKNEVIEASSLQERFAEGAARIDGQRCEGFEAYGKHLVGHFNSGDVLHVHLGLIGKLRRSKAEPRGAVRLRMSANDVNWDLRGPMVCDLGTPDLADTVAGKVGPDPLRSDPRSGPSRAEQFAANMGRRRIAAGAAILDQKVVAGIGNVYRSELLFMTGIDPKTPANRLDEAQIQELWDLTVAQLQRGVRLNRIVTTDSQELGYKNDRAIPKGERLFAYKRHDEPCRVCSTPITSLEVAARTMWMCQTCQK